MNCTGMTLWSCGLNHHVLDQKVEGSNLTNTKNIFQFNPKKISAEKSEQKKKETLSLIALVRVVAFGEEEETRRERERGRGII